MKNILKTVFFTSILLLPISAYAGHHKEGVHKQQNMQMHYQQCAQKDRDDCPMSEQMGQMKGNMGSMMNMMGQMQDNMKNLMDMSDNPKMQTQMQEMQDNMMQMHKQMQAMHQHMGQMKGMMNKEQEENMKQ